jgi:trehalose 6-phosphate synthase
MDKSQPRADDRRLIVVSNRVALTDRGGRVAAGGLTVALRDALKERDGLWFGWSGRTVDAPSVKPRLVIRGRETTLTIDLTPEERERYYAGFSNRALWPIMHYRLGLTEFSRADYGGYLAVNTRFCEALLPFLRADDIVWVHDYHLIPLGERLRAAGHRGRIGYFHHIPWPPPEVFSALPAAADLVRSLAHYDLVGLQTDVDTRNLSACLAALTGVAAPAVGTFPVGIDARRFRRLAERAGHLVPDAAPGLAAKRYVVGVDRLDYSKGIVPRMLAFEQFLRERPSARGSISLIQISPPSRGDLPDYAELDRVSDETAGRINAALADLDWTPIRVIKKTYGRPVLAGIYRQAAVGLVTPMRDGMNLVAKEFVAAQDPADPGVLILSRFAGAARQLPTALIVNPFDPDDMVQALDRALAMPLAERIERHAPMLANVLAEDAAWWRRRYLDALLAPVAQETRPAFRPRLVGR